MKRSLFFSFLFLSFSVVIFAQSPEKTLKQAVKALGGEKALRNIKSAERKGLITRTKDAASGTFQLQTSKPNFYNTKFDLNGFETEAGYNGKSGWQRDSREGLRTLTGNESRDFQAEAFFRNNGWLDYKKQKTKIANGGKTTVRGKAANIINLTTSKGVSIKLYFDAATNLLIREEIPAGGSVNIFDYADYRLVEGVNEPFLINAEIGGESFEIKLDQIIHNREIARENFDFPKISGEPLPNIPALLSELQANEDRIEIILENYSYTQKSTSRELGKDGVLREKDSETFQISFYKGNRIRRLIEKNGKPLSSGEQADEDKRVQNRVKEIEKEIIKKEERAVKQSANGTPDEDSKRISTAEVLRASRLLNPRRERFRGRNVIVFDFEPNPDFDFRSAKSFLKFFGKIGGAIWVDAQDKQVARIEAVLFDNYKIGGGVLANLQRGASFTLEQERVGDEIWLPSAIDINLSVKVLLFKGIEINQMVKSYDYRKFTTEVKDSKLDDIKN